MVSGLSPRNRAMSGEYPPIQPDAFDKDGFANAMWQLLLPGERK